VFLCVRLLSVIIGLPLIVLLVICVFVYAFSTLILLVGFLTCKTVSQIRWWRR